MGIKRRVLILLSFFLIQISFGQSKKTAPGQKPTLVVGLVIDQMRWDYLYRFGELYGNGGFKRLLKQGFSCENTFIPYLPTYTAVGHSTVYTGSVPAIHGIIGNNWYERSIGKSLYCTEDSTVSGVGSTSNAGKMSPENLWTTTISDELRLSNNFKSKVIGIAIKDRGAILPAGHSANAAYWFDMGKWISSTYYMTSLPSWVDQFNDKKKVDEYMNGEWKPLLPPEKYTLSTEDDKPYESPFSGMKSPVFPYKLPEAGTAKYEAFKYTPFASTFTFDFAKQAIEHEQLGKNTVTDFLAVSISSTDYTGHNYGPNSIEVEDTYLRLDRDIADFLLYLDSKVGVGNYTLFLTADHGAAHVPAFLEEHKIPGGTYSNAALSNELNKAIEDSFGYKRAILSVMNYQVYIDHAKTGKDDAAVKAMVARILRSKTFITNVFDPATVTTASIPEPIKTMAVNGYNGIRSGDLQFLAKPAYFDGGKKGTTHGSWNPYDSHIPLVWFGWGIKQGKTNRETYMTDIAATLAGMLQIQMPNGCVGHVIPELVK